MNSRQFRTKKKFGQHFLNNKTIATEIVRIINFQDFDQVIEIGPGTGFLTKFIIKECQPILIEIDEEAVQFLKKNFPKINNIIHGDFLKINIKPFLKSRNLSHGLELFIESNAWLNPSFNESCKPATHKTNAVFRATTYL